MLSARVIETNARVEELTALYMRAVAASAHPKFIHLLLARRNDAVRDWGAATREQEFELHA